MNVSEEERTEFHGFCVWIANSTVEGRVSVQKRFVSFFLDASSVEDFLMKSTWVRIPMTLGNRVIGKC